MRHYSSQRLSGAEILESRLVLNATIEILDIVQGRPQPELTAVGNKLVFEEYAPATGVELYAQDLDTGDAELIADINPGRGDSILHDASHARYVFNNKLYFTAYDDTNGMRLREYDPASGSVTVIGQGFDAGEIADCGGIAEFEGGLFFTAESLESESGYTLYRIDADNLQLTAVVDIGLQRDCGSNFVQAAGNLYFIAAQSFSDWSSLWEVQSGGTAMEVASDMLSTGDLATLDNKLYFSHSASVSLHTLHVFDPMTQELTSVPNLENVDVVSAIDTYEDRLYFSARSLNGDSYPYAYHPGTDSVEALDVDRPDGRNYRGMKEAGGKLYFRYSSDIYEYVPAIQELNLIDVRDVSSSQLSVLDGEVFFGALDPSLGVKLHSYSPDTGNLTALDAPHYAELVNGTDKFFFVTSLENTTPADYGLFSFDPRVAIDATKLEKPLYGGPQSSNPGDVDGYLQIGTDLYFDAESPNHSERVIYRFKTIERELSAVWPVDGPANFVEFNGMLLFNGSDSNSDSRTINQYDPINGDVSLFADGLLLDEAHINLNDKFYFVDAVSTELHVYDPVLSEITRLEFPGLTQVARTGELAVLSGKLYFSATDSTYGNELREYDPATGELRLVADIHSQPIPESSFPGEFGGFEVFNDKLYFSAVDCRFGCERLLREFDPISQQVRIIDDFGRNPGHAVSPDSKIVAIGERLYFEADESSLFYAFDPVADTASPIVPLVGENVVELYGLVYIPTTNGLAEYDPEMHDWQRIPGESVGQYVGLTRHGGKLYFSTRDSQLGNELHVFDPISRTIEPLVDVNTGPDSSGLGNATSIGTSIHFSGFTGPTGRELITITPELDFDFNRDQRLDCLDIDELSSTIAAFTNDPVYDLNLDDRVDGEDLNLWLSLAGSVLLESGQPFLPADSNFDGVVDVADFNSWNKNKFTINSSWCSGDFNADGVIDVSDFNVWSAHKFQSSETPVGLLADSAPLGNRQVDSPPLRDPFVELPSPASRDVEKYRSRDLQEIVFAAWNEH